MFSKNRCTYFPYFPFSLKNIFKNDSGSRLLHSIVFIQPCLLSVPNQINILSGYIPQKRNPPDETQEHNSSAVPKHI